MGAAAACALRLREAQSSGTPRVVSASVRGFELPMLKKPTTKEGEAKETAGVRRGHLLRVELDDGRVGWGEASPLPGLHAESAEDAGAQLRAMAALLDGGDRERNHAAVDSGASVSGAVALTFVSSGSGIDSFFHTVGKCAPLPPPPDPLPPPPLLCRPPHPTRPSPVHFLPPTRAV